MTKEQSGVPLDAAIVEAFTKETHRWQEVATTSPRSEMKPLLDAHFRGVTPRLRALEAHHCRTARTDVAESNPMRRFLEGKP